MERNSANKPRILVVGNASLDLILEMNQIPPGGETSKEHTYLYVPGGTGGNAALMLSRLGCYTLLCSRISSDTNGNALMTHYKKSHIDTRFISIDRRPRTGLEVIMLTETESNRSIIYPGANERISPGDVESAVLSLPDAVFISLSVPPDAADAAVKIANKKGIPVFVNAGRADPNFPLERLGKLKSFITDSAGITAFTGITKFSLASLPQIAMAIANKVEAETYAIKLPNGSTLIYDNIYYNVITPPCDAEIIDPSTAADTFAAAFTYELHTGGNMRRAAEFAGIVETMTITGAGASLSIPTYENIRNFISEKGVNFKL